jgi:hypothetical protein
MAILMVPSIAINQIAGDTPLAFPLPNLIKA